jgi:hypothetical protein
LVCESLEIVSLPNIIWIVDAQEVSSETVNKHIGKERGLLGYKLTIIERKYLVEDKTINLQDSHCVLEIITDTLNVFLQSRLHYYGNIVERNGCSLFEHFACEDQVEASEIIYKL